MITRQELHDQWSALSVEERVKALAEREIRPALKAQSEAFEQKRKDKKLPKLDLAPCFVDAYNGQKELSKSAPSDEERQQAKFLMGHLRRCAKQNLSKKDFARIEGRMK